MNDNRWNELRARTETYYSRKLAEHGPTPAGVDWNSRESQQVRFEELARLSERRPARSWNDYGCGYGAFLQYLRRRCDVVPYCGFDVSHSMIERARELHRGDASASFTTAVGDLQPATYTIASGIFNVKMETPAERWSEYLFDTLDSLAAVSEEGFAFNVLSDDSHPERRRPDLFYAAPALLFDHCRRRYSRSVAVLQDYGLYEFTVLVRKEREASWRSW